MKPAYAIEISKLKDGRHQFTLQLEAPFFALFPESEITQGSIEAQVELNKTTRHIDLTIALRGMVELACDRCLQPFPLGLSAQQRIIYSFDTAVKDAEDADLQFIHRDAQFLDLQQDLYDFVALSVPLRKIPENCPGSQCPPEVLALLDEANHAVAEPLSELALKLSQKLQNPGQRKPKK